MFLVSVFLFVASWRENVLVLKFENILHCGNKKYLLNTPLKNDYYFYLVGTT